MATWGCYAPLSLIKADMDNRTALDTKDDARLLAYLEGASRWIDRQTRRWFYVVSGTRYYTHMGGTFLYVDDLLSVTSLKTDQDQDRTFEETWTATDYDLEPWNTWPKVKVSMAPNGDYSFPTGAKGIEVVGLWGYGDGESATPYTSSGTTGTVVDTTSTSITVGSAAGLSIGETWLLDSEQVYCTGIASLVATVKRGVNGTTAAAHAAATLNVYRYPPDIVEACQIAATKLWQRKLSGYQRVLGGSDLGQLQYYLQEHAGKDPDVMSRLQPYIKARGYRGAI